MMANDDKKQDEHNKLIIDQFSRQAVPFSKKVPALSNEAFFKLIIDTIGLSKADNVLDIACGPGMLSCAMAQAAGFVTGIDLVPAMLEQARTLQREKKLSNMEWMLGDVSQLPFVASSFSAVVTRFSFHHFLNPPAILKEMVRVAKPGGKLAVVDAFTTSPAHAHLHNLIEKLRDDSHVKALSLEELEAMARQAGLVKLRTAFHRLEIEFEGQLKASFPKPGDDQKIRELVMNDQEGIVSCRKEGNLYLYYPIVIIAGEKV